MRLLKSIIASILTSATAVCSITAINSHAYDSSQSNTPDIHLDIKIDETGSIRADVIMENMPKFSNAILQFNLGTNWEAEAKPSGKLHFNYTDVTITEAEMYESQASSFPTGNYATIVVASVYEDLDFNGTFISFYIKKTDTFDWSTAGINIVKNPERYSIVDSNGNEYLNNIFDSVPTMVGSGEYLVGDVDNDHYINSSDTSRIMRFLKLNGDSISLSDISSNFNEAIPDLRSAYAADVDKNGYIDQDDANLTLRYYTLMLSEQPYDGYIGTTDIYEIYND